MCIVFFFFSSRRRHTRCSRDWSSDVCSSDLEFQHPRLCPRVSFDRAIRRKRQSSDRGLRRPASRVVCLSVEQFTQDLGGSFRSVRDTLVHILGGEWDLLTGRRVSYRSILDGFADAARQPFPSGRISQRRCGSDEVGRSRKRANRVRESPDRRSPGKKMLPFRKKEVSLGRLGHLMQHLANHATYRRGQIALTCDSWTRNLWLRTSTCF